ncbi:hypothetical protein, partial [Acetobacter peroxydans]
VHIQSLNHTSANFQTGSNMLKKIVVACTMILCGCQAHPGHSRNGTANSHHKGESEFYRL